jgi:ADP-heptose:LPS heptosyltransferase
LEALAPVLQTPGIAFYSLQVPVPVGDEPYMRALPQLEHLGSQLTDFLDTAGVIRQLDLVISVDTAVAHLTGALRKPVWALIPFAPDWRWFLSRPDTVWYPTMRLFRQSERGRWGPVIEQVAGELRRLAAGERR